MKFPYAMLRDFVDTKLDAEQIGNLLTMAGFELEGIEEVEGDSVLDIKVVSNRGDGLSVFGLSREILAKDSEALATDLYRQAVCRFDNVEIPTGAFPIQIETPDCTRYVAGVLAGVKNGDSPQWLQKRLRQAGLRTISLLVDLTNYLMLELGQPLHVFDITKVAGPSITVRGAGAGEKLTTLDGLERSLQESQMMICDSQSPVAVAGVMGGLESEVSAASTEVLLESAHFLNASVRRTRKQLGLSTEASYRFERSVDPELAVAAQRRFAQLLREIGAGTFVSLTDKYPSQPQPVKISVSVKRAEMLLGMTVGTETAKGLLERLGFNVEEEAENLIVAAPSWRPDIVAEEDLVEEIGRVHGYDNIPEALPKGATTLGGVTGFELFTDKIRSRALRAGLTQTISHSLRDRHPLDDPNVDAIGPRNPGSPEMAWLRSSLLSSLADNSRRNGGRDLHLVETGRVFSASGEEVHLALLSQGALRETYRGSKESIADFFSLKGIVQTIFPGELTFLPPKEPDPRFVPTQQAQVFVGPKRIGVMGCIHPGAAEQAAVPEDTQLAEFDLRAAFESVQLTPQLSAVSRNPSVRRDIAILVDKSIPYQKIEAAVRTAGGAVLERQWLFDVYEGSGIPEGQHSLAIALQLRKATGNFTDEEANQVRERVVEELAALGATTR
jgi:phenylalanyl-tRNA synthetase beta chain